jgi:ubiquinone/menaquinone biosynthesis C-methylase UbiE
MNLTSRHLSGTKTICTGKEPGQLPRRSLKEIPLNGEMTALEFGAGTGLLSFMLKDHLKEITLIDNSEGMVKVLNEKLISAKADNLKA